MPSNRIIPTLSPSGHVLDATWTRMGRDSAVDHFYTELQSGRSLVKVGSNITIQNPEYAHAVEAKNPDAYRMVWIAKVRKIRANNHGTLVYVHWYYLLEHAQEELQNYYANMARGNILMQRIEHSWGSQEVSLSDHGMILDSATILDTVPIYLFDESLPNHIWVPLDQWYSRSRLRIVKYSSSTRSTGKIEYLPSYDTQNCCNLGYNPETDRQIFCEVCDKWSHVSHLLVPPPDFVVERGIPQHIEGIGRLKYLPNIRGEGWLEDVDALVVEVSDKDLAWLKVGSRGLLAGNIPGPANAITRPRVSIGFGTLAVALRVANKCVQVVEELAMVKQWQCPICENLL